MNTNHPTVEIFFVYALTYCKVKVYKTEEEFTRKILKALNIEIIDPKSNKTYQETDTRLLCFLLGQAIPKMVEGVLPSHTKIMEAFSVKPDV